MPDYLTLRLQGDKWESVGTVTDVPTAEEAVRRSQRGAGRYAAIDWSTRVEYDVGDEEIIVTVEPTT